MEKVNTFGIYFALGIVFGMHAMEDDLVNKLGKISIEPSKRVCNFLTADEQVISISERIAFCSPTLKKMAQRGKLYDQAMSVSVNSDVFNGIMQVLKHAGLKERSAVSRILVDACTGLGIDRWRHAVQAKEQQKFLRSLNDSIGWISLVKDSQKRMEFFNVVDYLGLRPLGKAVLNILKTCPILQARRTYYKDMRFDLQQYFYHLKTCLIRKFAQCVVDEVLQIKEATVGFDSDGNMQLVAAIKGRSITVHDLKTNECTSYKNGDGSGNVASIAFSPDGTFFVALEEGNIIFWSLLKNGKLIISPKCLDKIYSCAEELGKISSVALSPDDQWLAMQNGDYIKICNLVNDQYSYVACRKQLAMALGPDGLLAVAGYEKDMIQIWNLNTWNQKTTRIIKRLSHDGVVTSLSFSADGTKLACCSDKKVEILNLSSFAQEANRLEGLNLQQELLLQAFNGWLARNSKVPFRLTAAEKKIFDTLSDDLQSALRTIGMTCT